MDPEKYNLESLKILVVDDSKYMLHLIASILRSIGVGILSETSQVEIALGKISDFQPDIIITEWRMKPINGMQFVKEIRGGNHGANPYVPIIVLTSDMERSLVIESRDVGVNEFLIKPISANILYERIGSILNKKRQFVESEAYFGPDRRRRVKSSENQRRKSDRFD